MSQPGLLYLLAATLPLLTTLVLLLTRQRARYWAGWLAAGVLAITVILSVVGLVLHQQHVHHQRDQLQPVEPWTGSLVWMKLTPLFHDNTGRLGFATDTPGIELRLGYQVDSLTTFLFVLITLVALAIHLVAIRSMWKEHKADLYDPLAKAHRPGRYPQFFLLLSAFTSVMLHLVLADNLVQLFACWELVGLLSYLLIGFYREQPVAQWAARKAFVMNRVGDAGLLVGIVILFTFTGTLSLVTVREDVINVLGHPVMEQGVIKKRIDQLSLADALRVPAKDSHDESFSDKGAEAGQVCRVNRTVTRQGKERLEIAANGSEVVVWNQETLNGHYDKPMRGRFDAFNPKLIGGHGQGLRTIPYYMLLIAGLGLVLGCLGKSAQWPLQTWLPDAMAGPTPVSALVHSATMVAAGVYLLARLFPVLLPEVLLSVAYVGVATALYGALCALVQTDVKRLLAYSTMSQLGLMMAAMGVGAWSVALWHLATHACCKALLFLSIGAVVDQCNSVQDISRLGGLRRSMPWLAGLMLFGCLSLMGLPLLPGWYSKDGILEALVSFGSLSSMHVLLMVLPLVTTLLTAAYLTRFWWLVFMGAPRDATVTETAADVSGLLRWPLVGLVALSLVIVWLPQPLRLLRQSEPVRDATSSLWATSGEQVAAGYFSQTSWLRPVYEQYALSPHRLTMVLALILTLVGLALPLWRYRRKPAIPWGRPAGNVRYVFFDGLHWDALLYWCFVRPAKELGHLFQRFDRWWWDGLLHLLARIARLLASAERQFDERLIDGLVTRSAKLTQTTGAALRSAQSGNLWLYLLLAVTALVASAAVIVGMMWAR